MLQPVKFTGYAVSTSYGNQIPGVPFEHTFVVSNRGDNWTCFGRGKEAIGNGARPLKDGVGLAEWANLLNGADPHYPTAMIQCVEGVCQNVANRLLVLAGTDVSPAEGYLCAVVLYGKYGFHLDEYVAKIKLTAEQLNSQYPGSIPDDALKQVIDRIGADPSDELSTLEAHFKGALPASVSAQQTEQLLVPYRDFQAKREAIFEQEWPNKVEDPSFQMAHLKKIEPPFIQCMQSFLEILGRENYNDIFKATPEQALTQLLNI